MNRTAIVLITLFVSATAFAQTPPASLTVEEAIARGFENSHRLAEARAREQGARAAATSVDLTRKPLGGLSAGNTRTNHGTEFSVPQPNFTRLVVYPDIPDNVTSRLSFQWPIYTAGRIDALERAAIAEADAAGADMETTRRWRDRRSRW